MDGYTFAPEILIFVLVGALVFGVGVWAGYWMGRNSSDKPLISPYNTPRGTSYRHPVEDPPGDLFNDAAYGPESDEEPKGIPTVR